MSFVPLSALLFGSASAARLPGPLDFPTSCLRRGSAARAAAGLAAIASHIEARRIDREQRAIDARARRRWRDPLQYRIDAAVPGSRAAAVLQPAARLAAGLGAGHVRGVALVEAEGAVVLLLAALTVDVDTGDRREGVQLLAVADVGDMPAAAQDGLRPCLERMLATAAARVPAAAGLPVPALQLMLTSSAAPSADPRTALAWALAPAYASARVARGRPSSRRDTRPGRGEH